MKLLRYTKRSATILLLTLIMTACVGASPTDEDMEGDNSDNSDNSANADDIGFNENNDNANSNDENLDNDENLVNSDDNLLNNNMGSGKANEFVNSAAGENFLSNGGGNAKLDAPASDLGADLAAEQNSSQDLGIKDSGAIVGGNQDAGADTAIAPPPDVNMGATDASLAPRAGVHSAGTVRYVAKNGTRAYDRPDGQVVKTYEQGDHPLVTADGEWVRTSDGHMLPSGSVSTRPVPRAKSPKSWR